LFMEIKIFKDYQALSEATARLIVNAIQEKSTALICLASGHTPVGVFQELGKHVVANQLDLSHCTFLSLDEWVGIDPNDPGSCLTMLKKDCFEPLGLQSHQTEYFQVQTDDLQKECDRINLLIEKNGGLDIMLVGVGTNGHIGMNEPGTSFEAYAHISTLAEETKTVGQKYFNKPTPLSLGITLGLRHLREAKLPIVMASGEKKAAIIAQGLNNSPTEEIPVSIAQLIPQGFVMLDEEAASLLAK
jgi:galactosamine-6-phosphate isomerase